MSQVFGSSVPIGTEQRKPPIPFFPNFMYRDLIAWVIGFIALIALATISPWGLGPKADPLASAPAGIKPEWYFLPLYQTLKIAPSTVFGISGELIVNALVGIGSLFWFCVPFIDRKANLGKQSLPFTALGLILIGYIAATIFFALRE
jgi:cytochrome b6